MDDSKEPVKAAMDSKEQIKAVIREMLPEIARAVKEELAKPPGKEEEPPPRFTGGLIKDSGPWRR